MLSSVARRFAAWLVAAVLAWTYGMPVHRAFRCVGDPPRVKTQHGCCPDDDAPVDSIGRPCCERLPAVAVDVVTLDHEAAAPPPPPAAFVALARVPARGAAPLPSRIRGGTSPPSAHARASIVLRI
jgi:hypothetical protein